MTRLFDFDFGDRKEVIFAPTCGFRNSGQWVVPMRAKLQEHRHGAGLLSSLFGALTGDSDAARAIFPTRIADFLADDKSGRDVRVRFDGDEDATEHRIADAGHFPETDANGIVKGTITLSDGVARRLLQRQGSTDGWLTFHAASPEHAGIGRVHLIEPAGVSVISDIDDTVKISEVPAGARILVKNTFHRDFTAAAEMSTRYRAMTQTPFHYVSGGPWQLYRPLSQFLIDGGHFPAGTFHMKTLTSGWRTPGMSFESLARLVTPDDTRDHKVAEIRQLIAHFPARRFILIGDSGEKDPEIYQEVRDLFGPHIQEIIIRDIVNARSLQPARLKGMTVVEAPTVQHGVSQFGA